MRKIFLAAIATVCSLTAIGQTQDIFPKYLNDWLLSEGFGKCATLPPSFPGMGGYGSEMAITGLAQSYHINSPLSIKGVAMQALYLPSEFQQYRPDSSYFLQIRDSSLNNVLASVRYDTIPCTHPSPSSPLYGLNIRYVELLFDSSIFVFAPKFHVAVTIPMQDFQGTTPTMEIGACCLCEGLTDKALHLKNGIWDTIAPVSAAPVPTILYLFPILDTLTYVDTGSSGGLSQLDLDNLTYIYPNPATKEVTFASSIGLTKIEVVNVLGQKVYEQEVKANFMTIDVSCFAKGNYVVKLHTDKGVTTKKFVVE
ncbi:MAG: T9SS type A sorting domain-containing protein [Bacteroidales bacterium]|jgi:hypothetical protein|nr:T9SS type A sorting domain-containing protein [Bacteroidales bacterium]